MVQYHPPNIFNPWSAISKKAQTIQIGYNSRIFLIVVCINMHSDEILHDLTWCAPRKGHSKPIYILYTPHKHLIKYAVEILFKKITSPLNVSLAHTNLYPYCHIISHIMTWRQSGLIGSELDSWSKSCGFEFGQFHKYWMEKVIYARINIRISWLI